MAHVQYTMFYSVAAVCVMRGMWLYWVDLRETSLVREGSPFAREPVKL
jgi:hypothetical protein